MQKEESRQIRIPDSKHPVTLAMAGSHVVVKLPGRVVADTRRAITLAEADFSPVHYIPREDVDMAMLVSSEHRTYCPYKGDASYFTIVGAGERGLNAAWSYEAPHPAVVQISGYIAFFPDRVDSIDVLDD